MKVEIGIKDTSLNLYRSWERLYEVAAEIGFKGVELTVRDDYAETSLWTKDERRRLRDLAETLKISTASLCLSTYWRFSFASPDKTVARTAASIAKEAAAFASEMEARNLLIPVTSVRGIHVSDEEARERWVKGVRSCAPVAEDYGVVYALENVGQPFARTGVQLASIVDEIGSPAVKVYYDLGNTVSGRLKGLDLDPIEDINVLGERISQVHMKDPEGEVLGEGKMDIPSVIKALKGIRYAGWIVFETRPTEDPIGATKKNLEFLRRLI